MNIVRASLKAVMTALLVLFFALPVFSQYTWTNIGLGGGGGQFKPGMAPSEPNTMIISCDMSGTYRTIDGGLTWSMID